MGRTVVFVATAKLEVTSVSGLVWRSGAGSFVFLFFFGLLGEVLTFGLCFHSIGIKKHRLTHLGIPQQKKLVLFRKILQVHEQSVRIPRNVLKNVRFWKIYTI